MKSTFVGRRAVLTWCGAGLILLAGVGSGRTATLSDPQVDRYNVRVGTQTFTGLYQFTTNTLLVETAEAIRDMGSDVLKMYLGPNFPGRYGITLGPNLTNLVSLVRDEPSCRRVFDMPFRHIIAWTYPLSYWWPFDGYSATERANEYKEFYDLTRYLLTNYDNSGKTFYLGHWEGDGYLCPNSSWGSNPTPTMVQGFIDCLNNRQKAIDDAKAATPFTNVNVFCYAEANRVQDAINNNTNSNIRMINAVIPYVTNLDYVSYSSYDVQRKSTSVLYSTLDYMEAHLPTNKTGVITGERIWIGEYGYASGGDTPAQQEPETRAYIQRLLNYPSKGIPFILFWEIYDNETNSDGSYRYFYLIDPDNQKTPCYYLHERFINNARLLTARFLETNGRLPNDGEFVSLVSPMLSQPLAAPQPLILSNPKATVISPNGAILSTSLAQGIYGDDCATVRVFYGRRDGGSSPALWENSVTIGVNTNFNPAVFSDTVGNLVANTNYFFRFQASNATAAAWAPVSSQFTTATLNPGGYGYRARIAFAGYDRPETLQQFPALLTLGTNVGGFAYHQFASRSGGDLRFTDATGFLLLPFEIEKWDTNGTSAVWVRVPQLTGTNDSVWAYWGNPNATNLPASCTNGAFWSSDHYLVWHLDENGTPFSDSAQQYPPTSGNPPGSTAGVVLGAGSFGGSQYLGAGPVGLDPGFTISAWVKIDAAAASCQTIWANKSGGWASDGFALFVNAYNTSDHQLRLETGNGTDGLTATTATEAVSPGQWHLVSAAINSSMGTARLFVDGVDRTAGSGVQGDFQRSSVINLGRFTNASLYFKGAIDEARIEAATRSSNWIWASWLTIAGQSSFAAYSAVNPRPVLSIGSTAGGALLWWPMEAGPFRLFASDELGSAAPWTEVTNAVVLGAGQWQVVVPTNGVQRFYRLQAQ